MGVGDGEERLSFSYSTTTNLPLHNEPQTKN